MATGTDDWSWLKPEEIDRAQQDAWDRAHGRGPRRDGGGAQFPNSPAAKRRGNSTSQQDPGFSPYQPAPAQPTYSPIGALPQAPQAAPNSNWDMTKKGYGEQFYETNQDKFLRGDSSAQQWWNQNAGHFDQPGQLENYWSRVQGSFANPKLKSDQAYAQVPGMGDFSGYYDRARERTAGDINDQLAARGMYGSSAGVDMLGQAMSDLNAQQANREADYALARSGLQGRLAGQADQARMGMMGLGGTLAGGAQDASLGRLGQGMRGAYGADSTDLARLMAGMEAALGAQGAFRQRGRDYYSDLFNLGAATSNQSRNYYNDLIGGDQGLMDALISAMLGRGREGLNQDYRNQEQHRGDIGMLFEILGSVMGGGGMGG